MTIRLLSVVIVVIAMTPMAAEAEWVLEIQDSASGKTKTLKPPPDKRFEISDKMAGYSCFVTAEQRQKGEPVEAASRALQCEAGNNVVRVVAFRGLFAVLHLGQKKPRKIVFLDLRFKAPKG